MASNIIMPPVIGLLMVDALVEVAGISVMVAYLHLAHYDVPFYINGPQGTIPLYSKPAHLIVNQGHTSNGAAGTAFVLGVAHGLILWRQNRRQQMEREAPRPSRIFLIWTIFAVLGNLLTLSALIYTFIVTYQTNQQTISLSIAAANAGSSYPADEWTPENWYKQLLTLPFVNESQKSNIRFFTYFMIAWRWNLIPLFVFGLVVAVVALMRVMKEWRRPKDNFRESMAFLAGMEEPWTPHSHTFGNSPRM